MAGPLGPRYSYAYDSDDGNAYKLVTSAAKAAAGSLTTSGGIGSAYPRGWVPRKVHGSTADGLLKESIIVNASNTLFTDGAGSFTLYGNTFLVTGVSGERRPNRAKPAP